MRQKLGQHFLKNKGAIKKIISALAPGDETIIEIGPGKGALTRPLAEECEKSGAKILAIEKDPELAEAARAWGYRNLEIIEGDVLVVLPRLASELRGKYKIVGNIPYYLTGFLLRTIGELEKKPALTILTVQKEVAERLSAAAPEMNRLSASVRFWSEPKIIASLPRKDFSPPPEVDSAIISLRPSENARKISPEKYFEAVRTLFAQPRKTILNNLRSKSGESSENLSSQLLKIGIDPKTRPQNLRVEDVINIAKLMPDM